MKTITNADAKIEWYSDDLTEDNKAQLPTFRKLFKSAVGGAAARSGDEAIEFHQLGLKLRVDGDIALEDAEFKLLKRACEECTSSKRQDGWIAHIQAQVLLKLKESEK